MRVTGEDDIHGTDLRRHPESADREEIDAGLEQLLADLDRRRRIERLHAERNILEIRPVFAGRPQPEPLHLGRDVLGALHRFGTAGHAAAH